VVHKLSPQQVKMIVLAAAMISEQEEGFDPQEI
jgi:hypothetical protein